MYVFKKIHEILFFDSFRAPHNQLLRKQWIQTIQTLQNDFGNQRQFFVCENHFAPECIIRNGSFKRLKNGAIPSIFAAADMYAKKLKKIFTKKIIQIYLFLLAIRLVKLVVQVKSVNQTSIEIQMVFVMMIKSSAVVRYQFQWLVIRRTRFVYHMKILLAIRNMLNSYTTAKCMIE